MPAVTFLLAACSSSGSGNWVPPTPVSAPNFVVVSTDWVCAQTATSTDPGGGLHTRCIVYNAHGVFKNNGAAGSAVVRFTVNDGSGVMLPVCTAAIPQTPNGGVSEASCQSPSGNSFNPPTAEIAGS